ncbi:copper transpport protein [Saxophila tyrrhenica]|uniref:Copper transport protein n=1 Tax=Saxophila tyrrhenica TaxID=1690608 RepID=A0AAV9PFS5_9PEZI|nr:copper transpport protein [Saxophila tyrrhenica]
MAHTHHDHGGMDMPGDDSPMCSMNMLFTWSTENLCIVFPQWRVTGTWSLITSLIAVVVLTAGYEALRAMSRGYEERQARMMSAREQRVGGRGSQEKQGKLVKATFYGVQVFYSMFIMLLFMTYNGWIMLAVGFGAFLGYLAFGGGSSSSKSSACH